MAWRVAPAGSVPNPEGPTRFAPAPFGGSIGRILVEVSPSLAADDAARFGGSETAASARGTVVFVTWMLGFAEPPTMWPGRGITTGVCAGVRAGVRVLCGGRPPHTHKRGARCAEAPAVAHGECVTRQRRRVYRQHRAAPLTVY